MRGRQEEGLADHRFYYSSVEAIEEVVLGSDLDLQFLCSVGRGVIWMRAHTLHWAMGTEVKCGLLEDVPAALPSDRGI